MIPLGLIGPLGLPELLIILVIVVLLFGAKRIPDLARGLGEGIRNFRAGVKDADSTQTDDKDQLREGADK